MRCPILIPFLIESINPFSCYAFACYLSYTYSLKVASESMLDLHFVGGHITVVALFSRLCALRLGSLRTQGNEQNIHNAFSDLHEDMYCYIYMSSTDIQHLKE